MRMKGYAGETVKIRFVMTARLGNDREDATTSLECEPQTDEAVDVVRLMPDYCNDRCCLGRLLAIAIMSKIPSRTFRLIRSTYFGKPVVIHKIVSLFFVLMASSFP